MGGTDRRDEALVRRIREAMDPPALTPVEGAALERRVLDRVGARRPRRAPWVVGGLVAAAAAAALLLTPAPSAPPVGAVDWLTPLAGDPLEVMDEGFDDGTLDDGLVPEEYEAISALLLEAPERP